MRNLWVVILAAGQGTRLSSLTRQLYGEPVPKQFAVLIGCRSLLQETLRRFSLIAPPSRTVVIVPRECEPVAREQLAERSGVHVLVQPENRGTGPGVLLPLAYVLARDPTARIVIAPSDHYVPNIVPFLSAVAQTAASVDRAPVALLGVRADRPETEYGWIVPGGPIAGRLRRVERFIEKPAHAEAQHLQASGALWNTFVVVGSGRALWSLAARRLPGHAEAIKACVCARGVDCAALAAAYGSMTPSDFSRAVLEPAGDLAVAPVEGSGWTDWGTPERVLRSLDGRPELTRLMARIEKTPDVRGDDRAEAG